MDLIYYLIGTLLCCSFSEAPERVGQVVPESIRVISYNIRYDNPDDGINRWDNRKERVAGLIQFYHPDLLGIQEGLPHQVAYLEEQLSGYARVGIGRNGPDEGGEYSAVFYDTTRFEPLDTGTFWLSTEPSRPEAGWDAALPRIVTWIGLMEQTSGEVLYLFNTHFDHRGVRARQESAKLILRKIDEIAGKHRVILTGDFNATPDSEPYRTLTSGDLKDGFYATHQPHTGPLVTFPNLETPFYLPDSTGMGKRIDYIFTNSGFTVARHAISGSYRDGRFPSDHLPVVADLLIARP